MRGKSLLNEKAIIIFNLNQSESISFYCNEFPFLGTSSSLPSALSFWRLSRFEADKGRWSP